MSFPIRCFTCGNAIGRLETKYFSEVDSGKEPGKVLDALNVKRYCCRRMFLGYVNIIDQLLLFPQDIDNVSKENCKT